MKLYYPCWLLVAEAFYPGKKHKPSKIAWNFNFNKDNKQQLFPCRVEQFIRWFNSTYVPTELIKKGEPEVLSEMMLDFKYWVFSTESFNQQLLSLYLILSKLVEILNNDLNSSFNQNN